MNGSENGRVAVVTGGSSGVGREILRGLAERGFRVLAISRGEGGGEAAVEALRRDTGNDALHFLPADLATMAEVRDVAARVRGREPRLDVLVNNAGAFFARRVTTPDGFEASFALNHLAPFLLTHLLLEPLLEGGSGRVVVTASEASRAARLRFDDPMLTRRYSGWAAYGQSKLANIAFTTELARRVQGAPVTANAFHPGFVNTGFGSGDTLMNRLVQLAARVAGRQPWRGAETGLYLAVSDEVAEVSGGYFADRQRIRPKPEARDPETIERLWRLSEELVGLTDEERAPLARVSSAAPGDRDVARGG